MKASLLRTALVLTLLTTLTLFFVAHSSNAEAAIRPVAAASHVSTPQIYINYCNASSFAIYSSIGETCFDGNGFTGATLFNVYGICSNDYEGTVYFANGSYVTMGAGQCIGIGNATVTALSIFQVPTA